MDLVGLCDTNLHQDPTHLCSVLLGSDLVHLVFLRAGQHRY